MSGIKETVTNTNPMVEAAVYSIENYSLHQHPDLEIIWVISGSIHVDTIYDQYTMQKGDLLLIDQNDFHSIEGTGDDNKVIVVHFKPDFVENICGDLYSFFICEWVEGNRESKDRIDLIKRLVINIFSNEDEREISAEEIIFILYDDFNILSYYKPDTDLSITHEARIINIFSYLKKNCREKIRLTDISENENIETTYLSHLMKNLSSFTFEEHIEFIRTSVALNLLLNTKMSVTSIAFESGFSDTKYLYKGFRKWFDENPGSIRKKYGSRISIPNSFIKLPDDEGLKLLAKLAEWEGNEKENILLSLERKLYKFDPELIKQLQDDLNSGLSINEISVRHKLPKTAVHNWLKKNTDEMNDLDKLIFENKKLKFENMQLKKRIHQLEKRLTDPV